MKRVFSYADNISEGRQFVYDENSHLIGEYRNSDQAQIVEYIWLGDIPIAAEMANDRLIYILTDHRGSPIRGYDAVTKANVWSLDTGPFGESAATVSVSGVEVIYTFKECTMISKQVCIITITDITTLNGVVIWNLTYWTRRWIKSFCL